jgi:hypothetical protein
MPTTHDSREHRTPIQPNYGGNTVKICITDFEYEGEKIRAGIDRVDESHDMVRQYPHHFAQTRSSRFMMRTVSPGGAARANPTLVRSLNEADLRREGWSDLQIKRALDGDDIVDRGPGRLPRARKAAAATLPQRPHRLP